MEKFVSEKIWISRVESSRIESKVWTKEGDETGQRSGVQDRSMRKNDSQRIHYPERNWTAVKLPVR